MSDTGSTSGATVSQPLPFRPALLTALCGLTLLLAGCSDNGRPTALQSKPQMDMEMDHAGVTITPQALGDCSGTGTVNLAQGRVASASSVQSLDFKPRNAFDGSAGTRWSSIASDPQWIQVNLGSVQTVCKITLQWEAAYAKAFRIEVSSDAVNWTQIYSTSSGTAGSQTITPSVIAEGKYVRLTGTARGTPYGYSLIEMKILGPSGSGTVDYSAPGWVNAPSPVTGVTPSTAQPTPTGHHEFQANCSVSRSNLMDDPIVFPNQPGASHSHTFLGNTTTNAATTLSSLQAGSSSCSAPDDRSAYWMPSMLNGDTPVQPVDKQVIYYKSGVTDYTSVRPFPAGLRFVVGDVNATREEFLAESVVGWECGNNAGMSDFPVSCQAGSQLNIRYQAPSCWDGLHLDSPNHKSHMAYPVGTTQDNGVCPASHPVALPKLEFKMAFPTGNGDTALFRLASGSGHSFHYDFFNAWDTATLKALVDGCIRKGFQCSAQGYDPYHPEVSPVLGSDYRLH